jgi:hypothetical protein
MRPKIYLGLIALVSVLVMACQMPAGFGPQRNLVGEGEDPNPGTWTSGSLSVVIDEERGQAVFINENGERFDVSAVEYEGAPLIRCVQVESFTEVPPMDDPEALQIKALVTGTRDDGTLGAWEIHNDNSIHLTPGEDGQARCLDGADSASVLDGMQTRWGWQYNVTGTATDGKVMIIVGYAVHARGFTYGSVQVLPGTSVGVYWKVWRLPYSRFCLISPPRIIGNLEKPNPHSRISLRLVQLKLFFFGRLESYLTVVNPSPGVGDFPATPAVRYDSLQRVYVVNGVENQDGVHAFAKIDAYGGITILPAPPDLKLSPLSASSASVKVNEDLSITVQITNAGVWPSEACQLEWKILPAGTVKLDNVPPLAPLASQSFTLAFKSADKGLYQIVANLLGDLKELDFESHTQAIDLNVEDNSPPPPPPPNGPYPVVIDMYNPTGPDVSGINWIMELYGPYGWITSADSFHYLDGEHLFFPFIDRTDIKAGVDYYVRVRPENPGDSWHYAIRLLKMVVDPEIAIAPRDAAWYEWGDIPTPNEQDPAGSPFEWPPTAYQELKLGLEGKLNCFNSGAVTDNGPEVDWFHFVLP